MEPVEIPLRRHGRIVAVALVDAEDAHFADGYWGLMERDWCRYAVRTEGGRALLMHRLLLGLQSGDGAEVDHINGDGLDNRRTNLRVVTHAQNMQNRRLHANNVSGYRGVHWKARKHKWAAQVRVGGHTHHLGYFHDPERAAAVASDFRAEHMTHAVER